jgi:alkylation response protein AidB-like acyl-CoA dehydrogenase
MAAKTDNFQSPDYFNVDELLTDEHKLIRESVRNYVKKEISPIIEDYAQRAEFPQQIVRQMGDLGCFGPTVPGQYGGGGLDYISYGLMMQELERGDSGVRSTASVQGSLGNPVEGATVQLFEKEADYKEEKNVSLEGVTDKKGIIKFKEIKAMSYYVIVRKDDKDNSEGGEQTGRLEPGRINKVNIIIQ